MKIAMLGWSSEMKVEDDSHCYCKMNWTKLSWAVPGWAGLFLNFYTPQLLEEDNVKRSKSFLYHEGRYVKQDLEEGKGNI